MIHLFLFGIFRNSFLFVRPPSNPARFLTFLGLLCEFLALKSFFFLFWCFFLVFLSDSIGFLSLLVVEILLSLLLVVVVISLMLLVESVLAFLGAGSLRSLTSRSRFCSSCSSSCLFRFSVCRSLLLFCRSLLASRIASLFSGAPLTAVPRGLTLLPHLLYPLCYLCSQLLQSLWVGFRLLCLFLSPSALELLFFIKSIALHRRRQYQSHCRCDLFPQLAHLPYHHSHPSSPHWPVPVLGFAVELEPQ